MKTPAIFILVTAAWLLLGHPFPQDPRCHSFANQATVFAIPNAANVLSNIPFVIIGILGLFTPRWKTLWMGLILTGLGSGYYHLHPSNQTLVCDRLPMAITFAAVLAIFLQESLVVWLPYSLASVLYWAFTDDLRPYIILQFGGLILLVIIWVRHRAALPGWSWVLAGYAPAKILEAADHPIAAATHTALSGHPWKHLAAALGFIPLLRAEFASLPRPAPYNPPTHP